MTTTVLIADDQALIRVGLRKILDTEPDMTVVGEAPDGADAVSMAHRLRPEVVLMDIRMPVLDGIEATRRIARAQPATRVLVLTTFGLDTYVYDALRAGASGFMLKDAPPEEIAAAVRIVASGQALLAPAVTRAVIEEFARQPSARVPAPPPGFAELTPREQEVLGLLARGQSNPEICEQLVISEATAKTHVAHLLAKLGLRYRVQAVILAYVTGAVAPYFYDVPVHTPAVDPVVQALALTDVVVEAAVTALLLAFAIQAHQRFGTLDPAELASLKG